MKTREFTNRVRRHVFTKAEEAMSFAGLQGGTYVKVAAGAGSGLFYVTPHEDYGSPSDEILFQGNPKDIK